MEHPSAAMAARQQVPWAGFEKVFTFVRQKGKNVVVQCNCCLPAIKHLSSAINSSSNLRKHLERAHPGMLKVIRSLKKAKKHGLSTDPIIFSGLADIVATARASQLPTRIPAVVHRTESPTLAEPPSHEDSMQEDDTDQESTPATSQPWAGGVEKEATLGSDVAAPAPAAAAEGSASHSETKVPEVVSGGEPQVVVVETRAQEDMAHEEDAEQPSAARNTRQQVPQQPQPLPWSEFEKAFTFVRQKGGSVLMQCNYCLPVIKNVSTAVNSSTNLRKHLEKVHPEKLGASESSGKGKKRGFFEELLDEDDDPPSIKILKQQQQQAVLERWGSGKEAITQKILDRKIMDFIVEETLPLETVDRPSFVGLVRLGLPKCLTIMCSETLRDSIEKRSFSMRERLVKRMGPVAYIATTADCWTDGRKSFLGVTAHWISPTTLEREFGALACKRLRGPHTYEVLAGALRDVYAQYKIRHKVVCTTTDNGSNFVKAFRVFEAKEESEAADASASEEEEEEDDDDEENGDPNKEEEEAEVKFVPISEILDGGDRDREGAADAKELSLPPHRRCASHTLNLVATQDVEAMLAEASKDSPLGPFKKHFCSLMGKCGELWATLDRSKPMAESIHEQCGMYLKIPVKTRWTTVFEALKQLSDLLSAVPLKVDIITDQCSLERVTPAESLVLEEYTEIMGPLAQSLEILQGENGMYMGYLLPTLYNLDRKLQGLENKPGRFTHGLPLLQGLRQALRRRFDHIWEDRGLLLAACLHPRFKVDWLESAPNAQTSKSMMEALLKAEIQSVVSEDGGEPSERDREGSRAEEDFFSIQTRSAKLAGEGAEEDEEVARYLKSPVREVSSLHAFPRVMRSFLRHNTPMPSSAAVEYLFSTVGHVMTVKRPSLSDELFEQLVLLRQNRPVF
nr:uncharacterized protein LOC110070446 [Pogona vitticeps]